MRYITLIFLILVWILVYIRYEEPQIWSKYIYSADASTPDETADALLNPTNAAGSTPPPASPTPSPAETPSHLKPHLAPEPPAITPKQGVPDLPRN